MLNTYFDLTQELNAEGPIAALASGQAVVFYRLALMSKDGDWILQETPEACRRVLAVLDKHGARYRPGAPLDRARLEKYRKASEAYLKELQAARIGDLVLPEAHERACELAERWLPYNPLEAEG